MRKLAIVLFITVGTISLFLVKESSAGFVRTCARSDAGTFKFGEAPKGCDAADYGDTARAGKIYSQYIFDRRDPSLEQRQSYMSEIVNLVSKMARDYIVARDPKVSTIEQQVFVRAILSVANVESYFSHYRIAPDNRLKLMTGDKQVSHGMMQINQQFNANPSEDNSFDLVGNINFGIEYFYQEYVRAKRINCLGKVTMQKMSTEERLKNYARSAYSAYNGGPDSICRFARMKHLHDVNYYDKYKSQPWLRYTTNQSPQLASRSASKFVENKKMPDVKCLLDGDDLCAVADEDRGQSISGRILLLDNGLTCSSVDIGKYVCGDSLRSLQCSLDLRITSLAQPPVRLTSLPPGSDFNIVEDRSAECLMNVNGAFQVGAQIKSLLSMQVRSDIGGKVIGTTVAGRSYQVIDAEFKHGANGFQRFYKIQLNSGLSGFIDGGDDKTYSKWLVLSDAPVSKLAKVIPTVGDVVTVVPANGIDILKDARLESTKIARAKAGEALKVLGMLSMGNTNQIYLHVQASKSVGYIYAGQTYPAPSIYKWVRLVAP